MLSIPCTHPLTERPDGRDATVSRLVMVDFTWAYCRFPLREDPEEQIWNRYRNLLKGLLDEDDPCSPGAWICHDTRRPDAENPAGKRCADDGPIFEPYRWFLRQPKKMGWRSGTDAEQTIELIAGGLRQCERVATRAWMEHQQRLLAAQMNLFCCRIYMAPQRAMKLAQELIGRSNSPSCPIPENIHICLGFRFQEHSGRYWLHAALSVWTYRPSSEEHAPPSRPAARTNLRMSPSDVAKLHDWCQALCAGFKQRIDAHFHLAEMTILDREHQPPQFWNARDAEPLATPNGIDKLNTDRLNTLVGMLPCTYDVRSAGVAAGIINEQILTLRRFAPDTKGELPCYVIYPYRGEATEREDEARRLVWELTDLEASAAAQLFDVVAYLDMYDSHLAVYRAIAHQAQEFWDQLALYLPVKKGGQLARVHRLIELVHQTLLQGIADLDQVAIRVDEEMRKVERLKNVLKDQFDQKFIERPLPSLQTTPSIRSSLGETGYFDKTTQRARHVLSDTTQVRYSYKTLLEGITRAFDEWRVRGTDVLQRVAIRLAVLVVVFAFIPEAMNAAFNSLGSEQLAIIIVVGMAVFVLVGLSIFLWMRRLGTLGSLRFRKHHRQLQKFLASCATDRLTRLCEDGWTRVRATLGDPLKDEAHAWNNFFTEWDNRDRALAEQCAGLLDEFARFEVSRFTWSERPPRLRDLADQVERWALKALLISERPRQFWKFPLPRLTFLYRFYPMMGSELVSSFIVEPKVDVVSDADLQRTVEDRLSGHREQIDLVSDWAQRQIEQSAGHGRPSARSFVKAMNDVGLEAGMTRTGFEAVLERMREQVARAEHPHQAR